MGRREMKKKTVIMFLGPPGSGKGTQAKLVADKFGFFHFISSQIGKSYIQTHNDPETQRQLAIYKKGLLFEPPWLLKVVKEKTQQIFDQGKSIVYDGSPRTLFEAEGLLPFLIDLFGRENIKIIEIAVDEKELRRRLGKRLICDRESSHVFIRSERLYPGISCPQGDGVLQERDLDKKELFETRMNEYKNRTIPALEFLKEHHKVITVNGEQSIENVNKEILKKLTID
jgi:adenylate kinase